MIDHWNFQEWLYMDRIFNICITFKFLDCVIRSPLSAGGPYEYVKIIIWFSKGFCCLILNSYKICLPYILKLINIMHHSHFWISMPENLQEDAQTFYLSKHQFSQTIWLATCWSLKLFIRTSLCDFTRNIIGTQIINTVSSTWLHMWESISQEVQCYLWGSLFI